MNPALAHSLDLAVQIAARTAIVLLFLVIGLRLSGKRQMGSMTIYDLAMIMLVANAVQNAMTSGKGNVSVGIASSGTLLIVGTALTYFIVRKPVFARFATGTPTVLVHNGTVEQRNLRREGVTMEEVMVAVREHELSDISQVKLAILEVDGDISIVEK